jgi:hypothetical protein
LEKRTAETLIHYAKSNVIVSFVCSAIIQHGRERRTDYFPIFDIIFHNLNLVLALKMELGRAFAVVDANYVFNFGVFNSHFGSPYVSASEIASHVGVGRTRSRNKEFEVIFPAGSDFQGWH